MRRGTGGNLFVAADATMAQVLACIQDQLLHLRDYAAEDGGSLDLGAFSVDTKRIPSGRISVTVEADLVRPDRTDPTVTAAGGEGAGDE